MSEPRDWSEIPADPMPEGDDYPERGEVRSLSPSDGLRDLAIEAYDAWRDYFDADERKDFWTPLVGAMGRLGASAKDRPELDEVRRAALSREGATSE